MDHRSLALAIAALSSFSVAGADAQSVYVAPGGVYVGAGPVYVTPAPNNWPTPYAAPTYGYGYGYGPPAVVAPAPRVVAPATVYAPNGYYDTPLSAYAVEPPLRPPAPVPYGIGACIYGGWPSC
jgi:hypothetical protein